MIDWLEHHLLSCFFKSHFGISCPGCGMQRSFIALLKGNITESIQYHIALIPFIITVLLLFIQLQVKFKNGGYWVMWSFIITCATTLIQFVVRQIDATLGY
jgi:hypothetical protein